VCALTFRRAGSDYRTALGFYVGANSGSSKCSANSNCGYENEASKISKTSVTAHKFYYIAVGGKDNHKGTYTLKVKGSNGAGTLCEVEYWVIALLTD
jgi:hypothetical protein